MKGATLGGAGCPLEKEEGFLPFRVKLTEDMTHRVLHGIKVSMSEQAGLCDDLPKGINP